MMGQDIVVAGNILVDIVKTVDSYPQLGMLANIQRIEQAIGGCAANTAIDLAKMDPYLKVGVIGRVGTDDYGDYALSQMRREGVDVSRVSRSAGTSTSFSDVMSLPSGERTFFHARGANAEFAPEQVDLESLDCDILHVGYLMLLDQFDAPDEEYGTRMARFLHAVQEKGIMTSVDAVSSASADYKETVLPALRYCDYVIVNEIESCGIWGLSPRNEDGTLNALAVREAMERMVESGVQSKVIVHSKEAGFCLDAVSGEFTVVPSLILPEKKIVGSVGAGDAFCAGCLYALLNSYRDAEVLTFASGAAACNLFAENSVDGMCRASEVWQTAHSYPRKKMSSILTSE